MGKCTQQDQFIHMEITLDVKSITLMVNFDSA